jgi:coproporphyrinogen III oxidase-like Fe-S oxidoreductase
VAYAKRVAEEGGEATAGEERLDADQLTLEGRYLGLRTDGGLPRSELPEGLASRWVAEGWAVMADTRIRLTPMGWLRLDALVTRLAVS